MKIQIIEDDFTIAHALKDELVKWQYEVNIVEDFNNIIDVFQTYQPDLILLDINLPSYNGYHWCQEIRRISNVPIIFISSRSEAMDKVMAIQMGGDGFIEKPFDMNVTLSEIQALLRRTYDFSPRSTVLVVAGASLSIEASKVMFYDKEVVLTFTELQILKTLFYNKNEYVSRNELIEVCWDSEHFIDDNTLAVNMTRLRKKLASIGLVNFIETRKNIGYSVSSEWVKE